jgi:hypothetical protein
MRAIHLILALSLTSCAGAKLERYGDAAIRIERGTQGVVAGVRETKEVMKADCVAQVEAGKLKTEAERMKCVEKALKLVRASKAAVQAVKAALVSFWTLYPVLEAKLERGEKLGARDWAKVASKADAVVAAYQDLIKYAQEAKR